MELRDLRRLINPLRLQILRRLLQKGKLTPGDLSYWFGVEQSQMSHNLLRLRQMGMVESYYVGRNSFYRVSKPAQVADLLKFVDEWCGKDRQE